VRTPAIDALAADGVVFERAYSHAPQTRCRRTHPSVGPVAVRNRRARQRRLHGEDRERLLPQMLRDRGVATGGVVSAYVLRKETGISQGFDFFDRRDAGQLARTCRSARLQRDGANLKRLPKHWLATIGTSRAFLFLHLYEPHKPYAPPARFGEYAPYDGEIAYADEIVGRLVRYLKTHQLYDRSTVILLADHGEGLGDHGEQEHGLFVYDEAIRVRSSSNRKATPGRDGGWRTSFSTSTWCDDSRPREGARVGEPARAIAQARLEGTGRLPGRCTRGPLRALSLRLERADPRSPTIASLHQGAREDCTNSCTTPAERTNIADERPQGAPGTERARWIAWLPARRSMRVRTRRAGQTSAISAYLGGFAARVRSPASTCAGPAKSTLGAGLALEESPACLSESGQ